MQTETEISNGSTATLQQLIKDLKIVVRDGEALLKTGAGQLKEKAVAGAKATDEKIRKNPYPSMGIVFGLGLAVGVLAISLMSGGSSEEDAD
ncbi:MAG: hypothetical protein JWQ71_3885 [Pedosphaera sp.]|nr:hypothetical protein [Pedosphaera sp.]